MFDTASKILFKILIMIQSKWNQILDALVYMICHYEATYLVSGSIEDLILF